MAKEIQRGVAAFYRAAYRLGVTGAILDDDLDDEAIAIEALTVCGYDAAHHAVIAMDASFVATAGRMYDLGLYDHVIAAFADRRSD